MADYAYLEFLVGIRLADCQSRSFLHEKIADVSTICQGWLGSGQRSRAVLRSSVGPEKLYVGPGRSWSGSNFGRSSFTDASVRALRFLNSVRTEYFWDDIMIHILSEFDRYIPATCAGPGY